VKNPEVIPTTIQHQGVSTRMHGQNSLKRYHLLKGLGVLHSAPPKTSEMKRNSGAPFRMTGGRLASLNATTFYISLMALNLGASACAVLHCAAVLRMYWTAACTNNFWDPTFWPNLLLFLSCFRRMFIDRFYCFTWTEILSAQRQASITIRCPPRGPKLSWPSCPLALTVCFVLAFQNYQLPIMAITNSHPPLFCIKKPSWITYE